MKKIFTLTLFYVLMCLPAHAIIDTSLPGAEPGALNRQNEELRELEKIDKLIEDTKNVPQDKDIQADTKQ